MVVIYSITTAKSKLEDRGMTCMFPGYAQNHTGVTYRMLNICTKRVVLIRGVIWLEKTYREYVSRNFNNKADASIPQNEDKYYN